MTQDSSYNFLKVFDSRAQEIQDAEILFKWMHDNYLIYSNIRKNDILQRGPNKLRSKERLDKAIDVLYQDKMINIIKEDSTIYIRTIKSSRYTP